jgi:hypothetical protein
MVTDLVCTNCDHDFSVGSYHYHSFDNGYSGRHLLVCASCGLQYAIEVALGRIGEEYNNVCEVVITDYDDKGKKFLLLEVRKRSELSLGETLKFVRNIPFTLYREMPEKSANQSVNRLHNLGIKAKVNIYEKRKNPFYGCDKNDRLLVKVVKDGNPDWDDCSVKDSCFDSQRIVIEKLSCNVCNELGSLKFSWDKEESCPACKKNSLKIKSEWLT